MNGRRGIALAALTLSWSALGQARDWPNAGGFEIHEGEQFCYLWSSYQGPGETVLSLGINRGGDVMLMVLNDGWSAEQGAEYKDMSFRLDGTAYDGGVATGIVNAGKRGFTQPMNSSFLQHFIQSGYLHVYKGDQVIDRLSLEGSGKAIAAVRRCVAYVHSLRSAEERERRRYEDLPKDPFGKK